MAANATCPTCGHTCRLPQDTSAQDVQCPACLNRFPLRAAAGPSLLSRPAAAAAAPNRTVLAQPEAMIRYTCPRCQKSLESPVSYAGQKLSCPDCNQRLQIPLSSPPPAPAVNRTVLAREEPPPGAVSPARSAPAEPAVLSVLPAEVGDGSGAGGAAPASRRESCLECGVDVSQRARVQTCPDCGSIFCSAGCYREHRYHAHETKSKRRPRKAECPQCGSTARPYETSAITQGGWITFALLLIFFFPLFWIGLLMTETQMHCPDCGGRVD